MATLIVLGLPNPGVRHQIQMNRHAVIGRDPTCDLIIPQKAISRFHAQVIVIQGNCYLDDLGSINGTFLNGRRISKRERLQDGDRIVLHEVPIGFYLHDPPQSLLETQDLDFVGQQTELLKLKAPYEIAVGSHGSGTLKSRLQSLIKIARDLGSSLDIDVILPRILDLLFRMFPQTNIGEIHLVGKDGKVHPLAMKHGRESDSADLTETPIDSEVIQEVLQSGQGIIRTEAPDDPSFALDDFQVCTACAPIPGADAVPCGVIFLQAEGSSYGFTDDDFELISAVAVLAGQAIGYSKSHSIVVEHSNTQRQLETARHIQLGMLPRERPQLAGYSFYHHYAAAERVGGDYLFYEMLRDGRVILGIADASGKGLPAAMNIVRFAGEVRLRLATSTTLKSALFSLNQFILDDGDECMFITSCIGVLDPMQHLLSLANAGHPPPMLKRKGTEKVELMMSEKRCFPLGIVANFEIHPLTLNIKKGDQVIMYTDGLSEAMNHRNELFGEARMIESIKKSTGNIEQIVNDLVENVSRFRDGRSPSDDMTIIGFERTE
ncbi:SpoIIE family protein phosphatase [Planctomicrobium sp. SH527]|uniref:SpoIIE family protein phosphatase n=1 Tax=Planctomicrobium sp. SH527 TaxID=3448123 RepID=UPI003F5ADFA7